MDTAKLELAVQRSREAEVALEAARADVRAEALAALQQDPGPEALAEVARVTGWSAGDLRGAAGAQG
ncbi:hypothetical protein [Streptomyces sp. NBC_01497]|uniref:hypothetical protein n=1 Tax=Streptomyces sp. NBC_01497 TaxID=2903885 RepID=UPI002E34D24B|nr:hypothetical protein [Streptomyces sp. NBC_01497]